jgi:hypothetical protein
MSTTVRKLDANVMAHPAQDRSGSLTSHMQTVLTQTSAKIFYAVSAAENLLILNADVSNAFEEAPPPKQGYYIRPDKAFHDWWVNHKKCPPIPPGAVITGLSAVQGHPESPRL